MTTSSAPTTPVPAGTADGDGLRTGRGAARDLDGAPRPRPHLAARLEDRVDAGVARLLRRRGWTVRIVAYAGYGSQGWVRVLARTLLAAPTVGGEDLPGAGGSAQTGDEPPAPPMRGWRSFLTSPVTGARLEVRVGSATHLIETDRGGYVDTVVPSDLPPGWHEVTLTSADGATAVAPVLVVGPEPTVGIVSDIDDTVMVTRLPRPLVAAWNTLVRHENAREAVPGMSRLYRELRRGHDERPVVYLSTGAWNAAPAIGRFLRRHDYPAGPLLLTDWGPTNTGLFRSGQQHKVSQLRRLFHELPQVRWLLVGDDGQHDPEIYAGAVARHADWVEAVLIRQLTAAEHVLSHGLPTATVQNEEAEAEADRPGVVVLQGADGEELLVRAREQGLVPGA
ncbi:App1 family protein [Cellulomonas telluris]|uniref:App1 family protein n=1 Tax=Cellulomonas telluris TaxID=2306636 RepID=UPI0010A91457|nr:phosphatase domain-containing protein [Cellulomonas telluris]